MPDTVRAFVAVPLEASPSLRKVLRRLGEMGRALKTVSPEQLHLTVKFLGDAPWTDIPKISQIVAAVAAEQEAFASAIRSLGAFPAADRARVVWTGLTPAGALPGIAGALNERLGDLGYPREQRAFVPHITLARVRSHPPVELRAFLEASGDLDFGGVQIDRVVLYQSELGPAGPRHTPLSEHDLR
jgi:2'-5' RNA ligase